MQAATLDNTRASAGRVTVIETAELTTTGGTVVIAIREGRLCALGFREQWPRLRNVLARRFGTISWQKSASSPVVDAIAAYFRGEIDAIDRIEVDTAGTAFQEQVWAALRTIPAGRTWSYRELARAIGRPEAVRAVGLANGANPIAIVVPCHRVIGADGSLTGYGGGLDRKEWLLRHEGAMLALGASAR